jgi:hypothetical protein
MVQVYVTNAVPPVPFAFHVSSRNINRFHTAIKKVCKEIIMMW